jgi:hypothetical protein
MGVEVQLRGKALRVSRIIKKTAAVFVVVVFHPITPLSKQSNKWSFPCHKSLVFLLSVLQEEALLIRVLSNRGTGWGKSQQTMGSLTGWRPEIFTTIKK